MFPKRSGHFVLLLAKNPDNKHVDEVEPCDFVAFYFNQANVGFQIAPSVWHQPIYPVDDDVVFLNKQGAVHACVEIDFLKEFNCVLKVSLDISKAK